MSTNLSIKNWAPEDRPREKLVLKGIAALSDAELLAILLGSGNRNESAVELAKKVLAGVNNNLHDLGKLTIKELVSRYKGIGEAKAITILAAMELGYRRKLSALTERTSIDSSESIFEFFAPFLVDLPHEEFWVLALNPTRKIIDKAKIAQGGISSVTIDVRLVMKFALEKNATGIALCHNHPSGNNNPSSDDFTLTRKVKEACGTLGIQLLDHVIIAENKYYSFADHGTL